MVGSGGHNRTLAVKGRKTSLCQHNIFLKHSITWKTKTEGGREKEESNVLIIAIGHGQRRLQSPPGVAHATDRTLTGAISK